MTTLETRSWTETACLEEQHSRLSRIRRELQRDSRDRYSPATVDWFQCQRALRELVSAFVNGKTLLSRRRPSSWAYHYLHAAPGWWCQHIGMGSVGPYSKRLVNFLEGTVTPHKLYGALRVAEEFLSEAPPEVRTDITTQTVSGECGAPDSDAVIARIRAEFSPPVPHVSIYVHGSMATQDHTAMSDVDDLVVLYRESWETFARFKQTGVALERCARLFQILDPLQHHGHWVFTEFDLTCLDESVMPLIVLQSAVVIQGRSHVRARVWRSTSGLRHVLCDILEQINEDTRALCDGRLTLFRLKALISAISLVPPLVAQLNGHMVDKKTAILESDRWLSGESLLAVRWATTVRESFHLCPEFAWARAAASRLDRLPFRRQALETLCARRAPLVPPWHIPDFTPEVPLAILQLINECLRYVSAACTV